MIGFALLLVAVLVSTASCADDLTGSQTIAAGVGPIAVNTYAKDVTNNVDFYLCTQKTPNAVVKSKVTDKKLFGGNIDVTKPVKILIHGYMSHKDKSFSKIMREAYLKKGDYNVINVDWSQDAIAMYDDARNDVPAVGKVVAKFIDRLVTEHKLNIGNLHVVGHSLGAHISGIAGLNVKTGQLPRVTGLDPAGPLFVYEDEERLKPSSAAFVDVIHSCGNGLGFYESLGHVDFYPNGGVPSQPGCSLLSFGRCSHRRAIEFFAESLSNPNGFLSRRCDTWNDFASGKCDKNPTAFLGENVGHDVKGKYYLKTGDKSPFALGAAGIVGTEKGKKRMYLATI